MTKEKLNNIKSKINHKRVNETVHSCWEICMKEYVNAGLSFVDALLTTLELHQAMGKEYADGVVQVLSDSEE
jgi:hypothetical protein